MCFCWAAMWTHYLYFPGVQELVINVCVFSSAGFSIYPRAGVNELAHKWVAMLFISFCYKFCNCWLQISSLVFCICVCLRYFIFFFKFNACMHTFHFVMLLSLMQSCSKIIFSHDNEIVQSYACKIQASFSELFFLSWQRVLS